MIIIRDAERHAAVMDYLTDRNNHSKYTRLKIYVVISLCGLSSIFSVPRAFSCIYIMLVLHLLHAMIIHQNVNVLSLLAMR